MPFGKKFPPADSGRNLPEFVFAGNLTNNFPGPGFSLNPGGGKFKVILKNLIRGTWLCNW
jgi:hypothetical protein